MPIWKLRDAAHRFQLEGIQRTGGIDLLEQLYSAFHQQIRK